jgi:hypothetical protein
VPEAEQFEAPTRLLSNNLQEEKEEEEDMERFGITETGLYNHRSLAAWTLDSCYYKCFDALAPDNSKYCSVVKMLHPPSSLNLISFVLSHHDSPCLLYKICHDQATL